MKIILYQPQIPQNTGNIVRTCAVTGTELILVRPLGFSTTDRWLKRSGLDYWEGVHVSFIDDLESYLNKLEAPFYCFSSRDPSNGEAYPNYTSVTYTSNTQLIFGSETHGLPSWLHSKWKEKFVSLPMRPGPRCLNLATSVGIALYEAWRQCGFLSDVSAAG